MAYGRSQTSSFLEGFSLSPLPYPVLLILAVISIFLGISWYSSFESAAEEAETQFNWLLFVTPIGLLLLVKLLSSMDPDWLFSMSPLGNRRRTYYQPSEGSSPWGVAAFIVLLLVLLQFQSSFRDSWLIYLLHLHPDKEEEEEERTNSSSSSFLLTMGSCFPKQIERRKAISTERKSMRDLHQSCGEDFPACALRPSDRKNWMAGLNPEKLHIHNILWPGTHDSATNKIGFPCITRPFAQCQTLSIYQQLVIGTRVFDIRVQKDRRVCHGILVTYSIDVVIRDIKKFLSETKSEIILLEIRTEHGHDDPPDFEQYLVHQFGEVLIHQDDNVFNKTIAELFPKRIICVWKPRNSPQPKTGGLLWSSEHLKDDWINTDLPSTKFESNLKYLSEQPPISARTFFYRVENTVTPQPDYPIVCVKPVTGRIHEYARLFITQCFSRGIEDRLQIFSTDFIDEDFVDACVAVTYSRIERKS